MRADRLVATLLVLQARGRVTAAELAVWALLVGPPDNTFRGGFSSLEDHLGDEGASTFGPGVHITSATIGPGT